MSLFHFFKQLDPLQNFSFTRLLYFPRQHVFVQNTINFVKVENNVQLTDIAEVAVQQFNKQMNSLKIAQLIIS